MSIAGGKRGESHSNISTRVGDQIIVRRVALGGHGLRDLGVRSGEFYDFIHLCGAKYWRKILANIHSTCPRPSLSFVMQLPYECRASQDGMHRPQTDKTTFEEWSAVQAVQAHDKTFLKRQSRSKRNGTTAAAAGSPDDGILITNSERFRTGLQTTYIKSMEVGMMHPLLLPGPPISLSR